MAWINWSWSAKEIYDFIRGMNPAPIAHTAADGNRVFKIFSSEICDYIGERVPGQIIEIDKEKGLRMATGEGSIYIKDIQESSGRRMKSTEYLNGKKIAYFRNFI
jgi:methionyl-tRNA formyltransferase